MFRGRVFTIKRRVRRHDGHGGWGFVYEEHATERGRLGLRMLSFRDRERSDVTVGRKSRAEISYTGYFRSDADIARSDLIVSDAGIEFEVLSVRRPSGPARRTELLLKETQRGR